MVLIELLVLLELIGISVTGAACLFGFYLSYKARKNDTEQLLLSELLIVPALIGVLAIATSWILLAAIVPQASVAISHIDPSAAHAMIRALMPFKFFALVFMTISVMVNFISWRKSQKLSAHKLEALFVTLGIPTLLYLTLPLLSAYGNSYIEQVICGFGFMLSFGAMLSAAHLFVYSYHSKIGREDFALAYPMFWKSIFAGLGLLALHQLMYFEPGNTLNVMFSQEIIFAILVLGCAIGGGPILDQIKLHGKLHIKNILLHRIITGVRVSMVMTMFIYLIFKLLSHFALTFSEYMVMYLALTVLSVMLGNVLQDLVFNRFKSESLS